MTTEKNTGGPAFPVEGCWDENGNFHGAQTGNARGWAEGMTLRDYFAAKALPEIMRSMLPCHAGNDGSLAEDCYDDAAQRSYRIADAMLKAREQ